MMHPPKRSRGSADYRMVDEAHAPFPGARVVEELTDAFYHPNAQ